MKWELLSLQRASELLKKSVETSAGVTLFVALVSLLTEKRINKEVAMTGEVSLRGLILPWAGSKKKCWQRNERASPACCFPNSIAKTWRKFRFRRVKGSVSNF